MGYKYDSLKAELTRVLKEAGHTKLISLVRERDALRAERVQLQAENESLRNELARMPGYVEPAYSVGSKVRVRPGTKTLGGSLLDTDQPMTVLELGVRKRDGHEYTVNVGSEPSHIAPGWWIKPDDITEVLT